VSVDSTVLNSLHCFDILIKPAEVSPEVLFIMADNRRMLPLLSARMTLPDLVHMSVQ